MSDDLISVIDNHAKLSYENRSEYIKRSVVARLKSEGAFDGPVDTPAQPETVTARKKPTSPQELKDRQLEDFLRDYYDSPA